LIGNDAANRIEGGLGDDDLTGGGGQDIFVGAVGSGSDVVHDFIRGEDRIDLSATGKAFADLTISSDAAGTVVAWVSGQMLLDGVKSVGAEDFIL
jgi:Ca2+-binding RTX toxin-like protein